MKKEDIKTRLKIYAYLVIALMSVLLIKLAIVQLFKNETYQIQAKENNIRLLSIKAPRGEIYTQDGEVLAANKLVYTLNITSMGVENQELVIKKLDNIIKEYYPEINAEFIRKKIELQKNKLFEPVIITRDIPWELVVKIEENRRDLPGVSISVEPLRYYPGGSLAGHVLGYIHSINPEELADEDGENYGINSLIGKSGIEKQYERELRGIDGARRVEVDAQERPVGDPIFTLKTQPGNNLYLTLNKDLQTVLEKSMDNTLKQLQEKYPKAKVGSAVVLNVKTGEVLAVCSSPSMNPDDWKGNIGSEKAAYYFPLEEKYNPLNPGAALNRALQVSYPPGSTFKPITGMAALEKNAIDPLKDMVNCKGAYWLAPYIKCTDAHGNVNYYSAMAHSCNTYFQEAGRRAGKDEIIRVAEEFGLGSKTGIDLPNEVKGLLPTPEWKKEINALLFNRQYESLRKQLDDKYSELIKKVKNEDEREELEEEQKNEKAKLEAQYNIDYQFNTKWQQFDTFNMSLGQGYNDYTVIQLANYVATIANGGYLMEPYLVSKIETSEGKIIKEIKPKLIHKVEIQPENIEITRNAMLQVTQPGGTAHFLFYQFPENIRVAAKTGTAQTGRAGDAKNKEFHGVFVAFAPFDDPEIAFAGLVEYGYSGGGSVGLVARDVFEQYFGIKNHLEETKDE